MCKNDIVCACLNEEDRAQILLMLQKEPYMKYKILQFNIKSILKKEVSLFSLHRMLSTWVKQGKLHRDMRKNRKRKLCEEEEDTVVPLLKGPVPLTPELKLNVKPRKIVCETGRLVSDEEIKRSERQKIPDTWRYRLMWEQKYCCVGGLCQSTVLLPPVHHMDHKIALFKGGTNDYDNFQVLCPTCHDLKSREERELAQQESILKERADAIRISRFFAKAASSSSSSNNSRRH